MNETIIKTQFNSSLPLVIVLFAWVSIVVFSVTSYQPVAVQSDDIAEHRFSGQRATTILEQLVADGLPHPAGSVRNEIVRERLIRLLESFGYDIEIQSGTVPIDARAKNREPNKNEVKIHNLIARLPPSRTIGPVSTDKPPILLVAHYDSHPAGPGAGDDGSGVASIVEIARMMANKTLQPSETGREVIVLLTDGEEFGMLGAKLFCEQHPLARKIGVAINVEARGTSGPSLMFETSPQSRTLIPIFANSSPRPFASSLFYEIYKRLPNDTDFTIFNHHGMLGYNFAIIGDVKNYHTPQDKFESVDRRSLQHHGENVLSLVRELQKSESLDRLLTDAATNRDQGGNWNHDEVVYFDVFGRVLVWWPYRWSLIASLISVVLLLISGVLGRPSTLQNSYGESIIQPSRWWANFLAPLLAMSVIFAVGFAIQYAVRSDPRLANPWPEYPTPILLGYWAVSFAITAGVATLFDHRLSSERTFLVVTILWVGFALITAWSLTGASFLFVVPASIAAIAIFLCRLLGRRQSVVATILFSITVGLIWLPLERLFYDGVGFRMPLAMLSRMSLVCSALICILVASSERVKFGFALLMAVTAAIAFGSAIWLNSM